MGSIVPTPPSPSHNCFPPFFLSHPEYVSFSACGKLLFIFENQEWLVTKTAWEFSFFTSGGCLEIETLLITSTNNSVIEIQLTKHLWAACEASTSPVILVMQRQVLPWRSSRASKKDDFDSTNVFLITY